MCYLRLLKNVETCGVSSFSKIDIFYHLQSLISSMEFIFTKPQNPPCLFVATEPHFPFSKLRAMRPLTT
ncbi:hypothetical protein L1887_05538 [Cichorium endivia]|nr:hypothetical protein L1887_05538 [Cichorium endivia]